MYPLACCRKSNEPTGCGTPPHDSLGQLQLHLTPSPRCLLDGVRPLGEIVFAVYIRTRFSPRVLLLAALIGRTFGRMAGLECRLHLG
jgi:hypothetical protein